ncbi:MAG: PQQ-binding-like beta-propeller repeat protein [Acidobacteriota bacterium]|nr:PQQ-binding-like beta-propeller repeat protein [Acidobacteriota bacterium]
MECRQVRQGLAQRRLFVGGALLMACVGAVAAQSSDRDYPQWRGVNRDGAASAFAEPTTWPEALTRRWKVDVGEGYATPLVVANIAYIFTRRNGAELMTALDAQTGHERWHTSYPAPYTPDVLAAAHGVGPKATPLFHHGRLFTLGMTGIVSAFDAATGTIAWQTPAPPEHPTYGMAVSPVGAGNLVIVHPGNHGPLTAFDADSGAVRWTAIGRGAYASPIIVELGGVRQVVTMTQDSVLSVSLSDGTRLWEHPWPSRGTPGAITPIRYGETLIVSSQGMGVTALKPARGDGIWVVDVVWETMEVSLFLSNPVIVGNTLFGLSEKARGQFFALDADTGQVLWLGQPRQASNTAVVKAGHLLLLLDDDAELIVARSNRRGFEPLARYTVANSATWAQPAVSGNRVFVKDVTSITLWTLN